MLSSLSGAGTLFTDCPSVCLPEVPVSVIAQERVLNVFVFFPGLIWNNHLEPANIN